MDKNSIELAIENSLIDRYSRTVKYKSQEYSVLISRVSIMFNIPSSELLRIISNISDSTSTEIAIKILTDIVSYSLPKTKIYSNTSNIFKFYEKTYEDYHTGNEYSNILFMLFDKRTVINSFEPMWVFENIDIVDEFLSDDNEYYNKLLNLNDLFNK